MKGVDDGKEADARAAATGSDEDLKIVPLLIGFFDANKQLRAASIERFGADGNQIPDEEMLSPSSQLKGATEAIQGDAATYGRKDEPEPIRLKKVGADWKVDLSAIHDKRQIETAMPKMQKVLAEVTADIRAGKYPQVTQARDALRRKIFAVADEELRSPSESHK